MRGQGRVYRPKVTNRGNGGEETAFWWLDYSVDGKRYRESSRTTNKREAVEMLPQRIEARRKGRAPARSSVTLSEFVDKHLSIKRSLGGLTDQWLAAAEKHLARAQEYFGGDRQVRTIDVVDVQEWAVSLRSLGLSGGTVRQHINSLSNLFKRAESHGLVPPGYNPVRNMQEKPKANRVEAKWLEVPDAALLLESARTYRPELIHGGRKPLVFPYELIATYLLTGGREDEVLGLEINDISFDRKTVRFRPNQWRRLKTSSSSRTVPLWPQLEEILRPFVFSSNHPPGRLLFPSSRMNDEVKVTDFRKVLDAVAERAGWSAGQIRSKMFRHTYCAARLQTLDHGEPVSPFTVGREMGHGGDKLVKEIYGHLGRNRHRAEVVEYRIAQHAAILGDRLARLEDLANKEANHPPVQVAKSLRARSSGG